MSPLDSYREATVRAEQKKAAFLASAEVAMARVAPARLKQDVRTKADETVREGIALAAAKVAQRPVATGAAAGAFLLFLMRRPIGSLFRRLYVRLGNRKDQFSEIDDG
jgi:hypothetical protein